MIYDLPFDRMHFADEGACQKTCMTILEVPDLKKSHNHVKRVSEHRFFLSKYAPRNFYESQEVSIQK